MKQHLLRIGVSHFTWLWWSAHSGQHAWGRLKAKCSHFHQRRTWSCHLTESDAEISVCAKAESNHSPKRKWQKKKTFWSPKSHSKSCLVRGHLWRIQLLTLLFSAAFHQRAVLSSTPWSERCDSHRKVWLLLLYGTQVPCRTLVTGACKCGSQPLTLCRKWATREQGWFGRLHCLPIKRLKRLKCT